MNRIATIYLYDYYSLFLYKIFYFENYEIIIYIIVYLYDSIYQKLTVFFLNT